MAEIVFIDAAGQTTKDYVQGHPTILVDIQIGFDPSGRKPDDVIKPDFQRVRALVDTGANHTIADTTLTTGLAPIRTVPGVNTGIILYGDVFNALLSIVDLHDPFTLELGSQTIRPMLPAPLIVGRDVLSRYRLIYDTPSEHFCIER